MNRIFSTVLAVAGVMALGACGGGGSSTPPVPNLSSAPGLSALTAYLQASHQNTLSATDSSGNKWTALLAVTVNPGTTTFNGVTNAYSKINTVNLTRNAVPVANSSSTSYYTLSPYAPLGSVAFSGTPYAISSATGPVPATLTVGASGPLETDIFYHDSTMAAMDATEVTTYSVQANNSTTLLLCLNDVISNVTAQGTTDGMGNESESDCYSVDASGNVNLVLVTLTVSGVTLSFK